MLALVACLSAATSQQATEVRAVRAVAGDRLELSDGRVIAIEGIQEAKGDAARAALWELVRGKALSVSRERRLTLSDGAVVGHVGIVGGGQVSVALVRTGAAQPALEVGGLRHEEQLIRAAREASGPHRLREPNPPMARVRGFGFGLYDPDPDHDYKKRLTALKATGATDVMLIAPHFMDDWRAVRMHPVKWETPSFATIERTARQAKALGLRVGLMPLVLLREGTGKHWRGTIQPASRTEWFHWYTRLVGRWADAGRRAHADVLVVGSELCSLERETEHWRTLIRTVRSRFPGRLTYSANWDQLGVVRFWEDLDFVGMTGYHALTRKIDPSVDELVVAWKPIRDQVLQIHRRTGKPVAFTEIGYASQDGINTNPWNYRMSKKPDWQEQADCYEAFVKTWSPSPPGYAGAWFYDWWRNNDPTDRTAYCVQGKPALSVIRELFAR